MTTFSLYHGDALEALRTLPDNSVDAICTDPPYGISFMAAHWDYDVPKVEVWRECLRVLKPGGHLLAFAGTRTQHRMAVNIEDAGFEIRDMIAWVYASGMPKSKNLDRDKGDLFCGCEVSNRQAPKCDLHSVRSSDVPPPLDSCEGGGQVLQQGLSEQSTPIEGRKQFPASQVRSGESRVEGWGDLSEATRQLRAGSLCTGTRVGAADGSQGRICNGAPTGDGNYCREDVAAKRSCTPPGPRSDEQYSVQSGIMAGQPFSQTRRAWPLCRGCGKPSIPPGLGTALKPAMEPLTLARKPFSESTVAANVLTHGTGAINIDACRVPLTGAADAAEFANNHAVTERLPGHYDGQPLGLHDGGWKQRVGPAVVPEGRWPANVLHDGSDEVIAAFPDAGGQQGTTGKRQQGLVYGAVTKDGDGVAPRGDAGSAARFFYQAKATRKDRNAGCERVASWDHVDLGPELQSVLSQARGTFEAITLLPGDSACFTTLFGKNTTDPSRKDMTFIIGTVARLTTELRTSNFSLSSITRGSILDAIRTLLGRGSSPAESAECISRLIPSITDERMGSALGAVVALLRTLQPISEHARLGNVHSTVKPTDLMRYLCRLITPPGGTVLDPFVGSGSTGKACMLEGFDFLGIDRDADEHGEPLGYLDIARARIVHAGGVEAPWPGGVRLSGEGFAAFRAALDGLVAAIKGISMPVASTNGYLSQEDEL